jgi:putative transposase
MQRKRHSPVQIMQKVKKIEDDLANGLAHADIAARIGVSEQTVIRWINDYGTNGTNTLHLKKLTSENRRLRRALSELELDKQALSEAVRGKY